MELFVHGSGGLCLDVYGRIAHLAKAADDQVLVVGVQGAFHEVALGVSDLVGVGRLGHYGVLSASTVRSEGFDEPA